MKTTVNVSISPDEKNRFQKQYPRCLSIFVVKCIKLALANRKFFEDVFFSEV